MPDFDTFFTSLTARIGKLLAGAAGHHVKDAQRDAKAFVEAARADFERWMALTAAGQLTPEDVAWLVQGKQELAQLLALKRVGLAEVELVKLRHAVVQVAVEAVVEQLRGKT
jgi:hypothetical protein